MRRFAHTIIATAVLLNLCAAASAELLFPPPEFESDYVMPSTTTPHPHQDVYEYVDIAVLFIALSLASYLVLKRRSRRVTFVLMVSSLIYFGFWRKGCVCPIGAIQNVTLSVFDNTYAVPIAVLLFFLLPLVFTLFFGRVFCAAVCPLGAIQDIVLVRPLSVPYWLASGLRLIAYLYLALAVLFAATGSAFLICRYDPFIAFFRFSGNVNILIIGVCFLLVGLFVGRPYCRFFCPYGVILRQLSRFSKWRVTITPDECIQCRLCEDSCPFGAIRSPAVEWPAVEYAKAKRRIAFLILLLPVLIALCGWAGSRLKNVTSRMHSTVRLAERIYLEEAGEVTDTTDPGTAFRATGETIESLYQRASVIRNKFILGGWLLGGFMGFVIAVKLAAVSVWRRRTGYEADRAGCIACGRCFKYCPQEHLRLSKIKEGVR
jgi:NosR/NirI family nitrous oxide reductase transcriptional regulator